MKERIKQLMEAQHMTQQIFADFLGINPATLSGIFNDRTKPTLNIVEAVKKKFPDINLEWLMFGSGPMFGKPSVVDSAEPVSSGAVQLPSSKPQEPMLDFGLNTVSPAPTPRGGQSVSGVAPHYNVVRNTHLDSGHEEVKYFDKPTRRVTEIRVYYDDQTWESFVPAKK